MNNPQTCEFLERIEYWILNFCHLKTRFQIKQRSFFCNDIGYILICYKLINEFSVSSVWRFECQIPLNFHLVFYHVLWFIDRWIFLLQFIFLLVFTSLNLNRYNVARLFFLKIAEDMKIRFEAHNRRPFTYLFSFIFQIKRWSVLILFQFRFWFLSERYTFSDLSEA